MLAIYTRNGYNDENLKERSVVMPVKKVCENCGKVFFVPPSRKKSAQFCSAKCKNEKGGWGKKKVEVTCQYCGKPFLTWEAWIKKGAGKYCSKECQNKKPVNPELLKSLYHKGLSSKDIGKRLGLSDTVIRRRLHEFDIEMRTPEEGIRLAYQKRRGPDNANFKKDGRRYNSNGYVIVWVGIDHPQSDKRGNIVEHRFVWQETEGCALPPDWDVHHLDGVRDHNWRENLLALTKSNHQILENAIRNGGNVDDLINKFKEIERELIRILTT